MLSLDTPIQQIKLQVFEDAGVEVFMKRDDLIHPFISGNKWRKLEHMILNARQQNKRKLVSFGGAYSNHLVALACAGASYGFSTTAFVRGEEVSNHMLKLCRLWGMELHFVSRDQYRDKQALFMQYDGDNGAYYIDEGGRGELGARGCEAILDQVSNFSHVIVPVGTGTTLAGIARMAKKKGMLAEGISVLKGEGTLDEEIRTLTGYPVKVHKEFHRGGYAKADQELMSFIGWFASETGVLLDQVYNAKAMMAVIDLVRNSYYHRGDRLLLVHTGGLLGLLS